MSYSTAAAERYAVIRDLMRANTTPGARVVELGAAPGEQSIGLAVTGYDVTAVDIGLASDDWEGTPEGTMAARFQQHGVELVQWNLEETPYPLPDSAFDAVVMTEVFEHLRDYPIRSLEESRRILRPGGCLYFTTPNAAYVGNRARLAVGRNVATPLEDWIGGVPHARHAREYTFAEIRELLERAGLQVVLMTGRHLHVASGRTSRAATAGKGLLDRIAAVRPTLGPAIIAVARRPVA